MRSSVFISKISLFILSKQLFFLSCRRRLFNMINDLPTIFEVVSGTAKKQSKDKSSMSNHSSTKSKSNSKVVIMVIV